MFDAVHRAADGGDITCHAGGGFVLAHQDRLDVVAFVGFQRRQVLIHGRAFTPRRLDHLDLESESARHVGPQVAELAEACDENLCAGIETVRERRLPATGARRGEEERMSGDGFENRLQAVKASACEAREVGRAMILRGNRHGAQDAIRNIGRTWDK